MRCGPTKFYKSVKKRFKIGNFQLNFLLTMCMSLVWRPQREVFFLSICRLVVVLISMVLCNNRSMWLHKNVPITTWPTSHYYLECCYLFNHINIILLLFTQYKIQNDHVELIFSSKCVLIVNKTDKHYCYMVNIVKY